MNQPYSIFIKATLHTFFCQPFVIFSELNILNDLVVCLVTLGISMVITVPRAGLMFVAD